MKKLTSILLALVLLCSCIPAFAVSDCSASYKDGVLYYSCNVDTHEDYPNVYQVEVFLDGKPLQSSSNPSLSSRKTVHLDPGKHTVTFSDLKSSQSVSFAVSSTGGTICAHPKYKLTDINTSTSYLNNASNPNVHTISTTKTGIYKCTECDDTKEELIGTTTATESHKLSSTDDTTCDRCLATIGYDVTTKVTKVELSESGTVNLAIGDTLVLGTTLTPSNGAIALKWSSSKSSCASVDQNGVVTAKKTGSATITVKTANGKKDTVKIKVVDPDKVAAIKLDKSGTQSLKVGSTLKLAKGSSLTLTGVVEPTTADPTFAWKTSSSKYVTVSGNGEKATITGKAIGTSTITVTAGGKKDTVKVSVYDPYAATKIELDKSGTYIMGIGETLKLGTTLTPSTAKTDLKWSSSKTKYATVDENGVVTAVKSGKTVTITCAVEGNTKVKTTVKVKTVK